MPDLHVHVVNDAHVMRVVRVCVGHVMDRKKTDPLPRTWGGGSCASVSASPMKPSTIQDGGACL